LGLGFWFWSSGLLVQLTIRFSQMISSIRDAIANFVRDVLHRCQILDVSRCLIWQDVFPTELLQQRLSRDLNINLLYRTP
jgi:hypothetical protein